MLGLNTLRSGGSADDNLDALDVVLASNSDNDGDVLDDGADLDDDDEGLGDRRDMEFGCSSLLPDTDFDGLSDRIEVRFYGSFCFSQDTDFDGLGDGDEVNIYGSSPIAVDTDFDGCSDGEEVGPDPALGGLRDPVNFWDFFDVFAPSIPDQAITIADISHVVARFGSSGSKSSATPCWPRRQRLRITPGMTARHPASTQTAGHRVPTVR